MIHLLKRFNFLSILLLVTIFSHGQTVQRVPEMRVNDRGIHGVTLSWNPEAISTHPVNVDGTTWQYLRLEGLPHTKEVGLPAMPCQHMLIAIPQGADVSFRITKAEYYEIAADFPVHPALEPATDTYGAAEPDFTFNQLFYQTDTFYPGTRLLMEEVQYKRELPFAVFTFYPVSYNPLRNVIRVYTALEAAVDFTGGSRFLTVSDHSDHYLSMLSRGFLNGEALDREISNAHQSLASTHQFPNYIIITHSNYMAAAQRLANWKQQFGHKVEVIDGTGLTSAQVKTAVHTRYHSWTPKPDFLLIIGDHPDIPGQVINGSYGTYATDQYYVCTGPGNDFVADMAKGRISVSSLTEAHNVVTKIIQYESAPPTDTSFFKTGLHAAYFQHLSNGYAERRFAQTSEELRDYMTTAQGYNVTRVYVTGSTVSPTNWNNGLYSAGEPIPLYLRKPTFPWTGNAAHINTAINAGAGYVLHRDHGYETGWGDPAYSNSNINALNNGIKTPVVMTINCLTGKYYHGECFSERFMRKYPGGAVGVFGHAEISLSGYNDALAFGIFDAIWASPGCIPVFTGSGGIKNLNLPSHPPILTMGDVANHALIRMTQTWGTHQYTNELFHYFGDPSMRMYTRPPLHITATHSSAIQCGSDTALVVSSNCQTGKVTLIVDGETVAVGTLANGSATLTFPQLSGVHAILTITDTNAVVYFDTLLITGGCPKSVFTHAAPNYCVAETVTFSDNSSGTISTYHWNFGSGAIPATATGQGPHQVNYSTGGHKIITLTVTGTASHQSFTQIYIDSICKFIIPGTGNYLVNRCAGMVQDDGGDLNYSNNTDGSITISPPGAAVVNLLFSSFNFENNTDFLRIYDGPNTASPLIGAFTGNTLPGTSGMIASTTGSITLQQVTNGSNTFSGFTLTFQCAMPNSPPQNNFILSDSNVCNGTFDFTDLTFNGPVSWTWYFGDGTTSNLQHPQHQYLYNGTYHITLVTTNQFGTDSVVKYGFVTVNMPEVYQVTGATRCKDGKVTLQAIGSGTLRWYAQASGGAVVGTGPNFITPNLTQTTTYFVESEMAAPVKYTGKPDNGGTGAFLGYEHYLVFNASAPFRINSVKVYAQSAGNRTVQLRNSSGTTLQTVTLYMPAGESRVTLNFDVPVGNNLRLVATGTPNLYRNTDGLAFPYVIPGLLSIHSTSATSNPTGYYYYFYDWEVATEPCRSSRVPVVATWSDSLLPMAGFLFTQNTNQVQFANTSADADSYQWDFGDGGTSTIHNPFYVYQSIGQYYAVLKAMNACGTDSVSEMIDITTGIGEVGAEGILRWYPNPASDHIMIETDALRGLELDIRFTDPAGRLVLQRTISVTSGKRSHSIDISGLNPGIWLIQILGEGLNKTEKLIVSPR